MANYYWLKLHYDLLDDWKVGTLPDSLKWRFIQCLLVAGETNENGFLPPLTQFAYRIRPITPESLQKDLAHLAASELVELKIDDSGAERWYISNYEKRQARKTAAERKRSQRERERNAAITDKSRNSHEPVTTRPTDKIRIDKDKDKNKNGSGDGFSKAIAEYESNIALITPMVSDAIGDAVDEFGADDVIEAINVAVKNDVRKWNYINGILKRWRKNGKRERTAVKVESDGGMYV